jgi:tetratricopeptide (TPR) repeat protein
MTEGPRASAARIFTEALELPAADREAFVAERCGGDRALRDEVLALLAADREAGDFLAGPADRGQLAELAADLARDDGVAASLPDPNLGRQVGAHRLVERIGTGGMGAVYLAERTGGDFAQRVAVKLVRRGLDTEELLLRFRRERRLLAQLEHPHVARLLDGGTTDDGQPYLVLEYVDGAPIDTYCASRDLPLRRRLELFRDVCAAADHAHRQLVVHRDLKPSNVLVTPDGTCKLLDFGIAKLLDADEDDPLVTRTDMRLYSPRYASPEQIRGEPVTTACDIYSLGVMLYELLSGTSPYPIGDGSATTLERQVLEHQPARPSTVAGTANAAAASRPLRRQLAGDLDTIVLQALRKEPGRRYASVAALAADLERYLEGRPVLARPDTLGYRTGKFLRRNLLAVGAAAVVVMALVTTTVVSTLQSRRAATARHAAEQVSGFLAEMLASVDPEVARGQDTLLLRNLLDEAAARVDAELAGAPTVAIELHRTIGDAYLSLAEHEQAERHLRRALELAGATGDASLIADLRHDLGRTLYDAGRLEPAAEAFRAALAEQERHDALAAEIAAAVSRFRLGKVLEALGEGDEAEAALRESVAAMQSGPARAALPNALEGLGLFVMYNRQAHAEAESLFTAAIATSDEAAAADPARLTGAAHISPLDRVSYRQSLATARRYQGDLAGAEAAYREALAGYLAIVDDSHPLVATLQDQLATALASQERWDEAEALYRAALASLRAALGDEHRDVGTTANNLAGMLRQAGRPAEAEPYYREALRIYRAALGEEHAWVGIVLGSVAENELALGRWAEAEATAEACLRIRRRIWSDDHWRIASVESIRAAAIMEAGDPAAARPILLASYEVLAASLGEESAPARVTAGRLAEACARLDEADEADGWRALAGS